MGRCLTRMIESTVGKKKTGYSTYKYGTLQNLNWSTSSVFLLLLFYKFMCCNFSEYLPLLLGPKLMKDFDLEIVKGGYYYGYDATYDATVSNSFAAAAFR